MKHSLIWKAAALLLLAMACTQEQNGDNDVPEQNDPKELVITAEAVNVTEWSATLTAFANPTPEMGAIEMGILYSTAEDPSLDNSTKLTSVELDVDNKYKVSATGLASGTTYYYKSYVLYGGVYRFGKIMSFRTKEIEAHVITGESLALWNTASLQGGISVNTIENLPVEVWFLYGSEDMGTLDALKEGGTSRTTGIQQDGSFFISVGALCAGTTYTYVACSKVYDKEFYGSVETFSTKDVKLSEGTIIDMGLSVRWASCNLGASSPEESGDYYAWGELETKTSYTRENYTYSSNPTILPLTADVAHKRLHGDWRMPTLYEFQELVDKCDCIWGQYRGKHGSFFISRVSGYTDMTIFLPAAGYWYGSGLKSMDSYGGYWSSSLRTDYRDDAWSLYVSLSGVGISRDRVRYVGLSVRPVYIGGDVQDIDHEEGGRE